MTPGELIRVVAAALDVPVSVVVQHDRRLAEEGFRTKGGRGSSSPDVTTEDAAKLVTAVLSGERYADTFQNVRNLWDARVDQTPKATWSTSPDRDPEMAFKALPFKKHVENVLGNFAKAVESGSTFGGCLTALIEDAMSWQLSLFIGDNLAEQRAKFQIKVVQPSIQARVGFSNGEELYLEYYFTLLTDKSGVISEVVITREVTAIPLIRIAEAFRA